MLQLKLQDILQSCPFHSGCMRPRTRSKSQSAISRQLASVAGSLFIYQCKYLFSILYANVAVELPPLITAAQLAASREWAEWKKIIRLSCLRRWN